MCDANRILRVTVWRQHILVDWAIGANRIDDCGCVLLAVGCRNNKARLASATDGAAQVSLIDASSFRRPDGRKVVLGIKDRVAKDEICFAVEVRRTRLGDDLNPSSSGASELRGIGIVVDANFLNCRS